MSFIFSILFFFLFIGLFIIVVVLGFLRSVFRFGKRKNPMDPSQSQDIEQPPVKPKIFDKKEGEYVDYEELD